MYTFTVQALDWLNVSRQGLIYFSAFTALSGIYYGTLVVLVRDFLILFTFAFMFFAISWYYAKGHQRASPLILLLVIVLASLWFRSLSSWLVYPLIAGVTGELFVASFFRKVLHRRIVLAGVAMVVVFAVVFFGGLDEIERLYQINVVEARPYQRAWEMFGTERARSLLDPFKAVLGPGLIRPLLPEDYFLVWVPSHAAFYWWGTLFWYANLIVSAPLLLRRPLAFANKRGAIFVLLIFLFVVGAYTVTYGTGMGMRKRAMFHFLYTLLITVTYCTPLDVKETDRIWRLRLPLPVSLLRLAVIVGLMVATILSIERVP